MLINLDTLIKNIRTMVSGVVIKYNRLAKEHETLESIKSSDIYIAAREETDSFINYPQFSLEAIIAAGLTEPKYNPLLLSQDKNAIPTEYRDRVVKEQRKIVIRDYVEKNEYYRMLNGLPPLDTPPNKFFYLLDEEYAELGIDKTPLHLLNANIIYALEKDGKLKRFAQFKKENPYLDFIGPYKIDIALARRANNFSLLKITRGLNDEFYSAFIRYYEQNREYYATVIHSYEFANRYEYYDNFIAFCIMIMTIQRLVSNTFKFGIERNFFDWSFIQAMYEMYNIPFVEDLPMDYHVIILKNLNDLLRHKSTDKVLFDILSLLGYDRMNIFKYYLVKQQKLDNNGNPIFVYKTINTESGPETVEDVSKMYDFYFQAVNIKERNTPLALMDENNRKKYVEITSSDPYWWEDEELEKLKYETEYNYMESKYLSMNLMYKMTEMLFEITYAFRMIMDKKDETEKLKLSVPKVYADKEFNLFDILIFMVTILCKKHGFGNQKTILTYTECAHIYGFNFEPEDIATVKKIISDNQDKFDPDRVKFLNDLKIKDKESANLLFENIRDFHDYLTKVMLKTQDVKEYRMYQKVFNIIRVVENNNKIFKISDGSGGTKVAESYYEFLKSRDPILADLVDRSTPETVNDTLEHIIAVIGDYMNNMKYTYYLNDNNSPVFKSISTLLNFFKSYTVDLSSFNIIYQFDSRFYNALKILDELMSFTSNIMPSESFNFIYSDIFHLGKIFIPGYKDTIPFRDDMEYLISLDVKDKVNLYDRFISMGMTEEFKDYLDLIYTDVWAGSDTNLTGFKDGYFLTDTFYNIHSLTSRDTLKLIEILEGIHGKYKFADNNGIKFKDEQRLIKLIALLRETVLLKDKCMLHDSFPRKDKLSIREFYKALHQRMAFADNQFIKYKDKIHKLTHGASRRTDKFTIYDKDKIMPIIKPQERNLLGDNREELSIRGKGLDFIDRMNMTYSDSMRFDREATLIDGFSMKDYLRIIR